MPLRVSAKVAWLAGGLVRSFGLALGLFRAGGGGAGPADFFFGQVVAVVGLEYRFGQDLRGVRTQGMPGAEYEI